MRRLKLLKSLRLYQEAYSFYTFKLPSAWLRGVVRHGLRTRRTIAFSPDTIFSYSQMTRIMLLNRYKCAKSGEVPDIAMYWAYGDGYKSPTAVWKPVINANCRDISKARLDAEHRAVFGYGVSIDPCSYQGLAFVKSDGNAVHDGKLVELPLASPDPDKLYQRNVNNEMEDGTREDIRIPYVGGAIPHVQLVYRHMSETIGDRIKGRVKMVQPSLVLSDVELDKVGQLCRRLGLDFGELDALRDKENGLLYVVDVNRAVGRSTKPREMTSERDYWSQLTEIADLFDSAFANAREE